MDRFWKLCLTCCLVAGMAACGPKDDNNENNTNNTMTNNTTSSNNTNSNNTNNTNNTNSNNTNNTTPNNTNNNTDNQCNAAGEDCNIGNPTNAGFLCIEGTCREECNPQADPTDCRSGALCFQNPNGAQEFYCQPSDCNGWLDTTSCMAGEQCIEARNDADICFPVGNLAEGDACQTTDMNPFPCGPGTYCAFGECQAICETDDECTGDGERCINGLLGATTGICEVGCDSYSFGQCPDGQGCYPITGDEGVCDTTGDIAPYQACTPRATAEDEDPCGENTACIGLVTADGATEGRCLPFCDPSLELQGEANATCPGPSDAGYGRFVHLTEGAGPVDIYVDGTLLVDDLAEFANSGAFAEISAGMHTVDVVAGADADNSNPIRTFNPTVAGGAAVTWGVVPDETNVIDVVTVDVPRNVAAPTAGNATLRAVHGIPDAPAVDVVAYAAGATDLTTGGTELAVNLATGTAGSFATVPAATYDIYIFPNGAVREAANAAVSLAGVAVADQAHASAWARGTLADTDGADPGLTLVDYASAPAARALSGFCTDLSQDGVPTPRTGFCWEDCGDAATYGTGACSGPSDFCQPFRGAQACWPGGPNGLGDACDPNNVNDDCGAGVFCERAGDDSGVCRAYCETDGNTNPALTCAADEVCLGDGDVGQCGLECTPGADFADTATCPANLQSCFPNRGNPTCTASGSAGLGDTCDPLATTCGAGDVCVNGFGASDPTAEDPFADGQCYEGCNAFAADPGCPSGEVCQVDYLDVFLQSRDLGIGFCEAPDEMLSFGDACGPDSFTCADGGWCLDAGNGPTCLQLCDPDNPVCESGSCTALGGGQIPLGACL